MRNYVSEYFLPERLGKAYHAEAELYQDLFSYVDLCFALLGASILPENQVGFNQKLLQKRQELLAKECQRHDVVSSGEHEPDVTTQEPSEATASGTAPKEKLPGFYLRQFSGTQEEAYESVFRERLEVTQLHPQIAGQLHSAQQYIRNRLLFTRYRGRGFRFLRLIRQLKLNGLEQWFLLLGMTTSYDEKYGFLFFDLQGRGGRNRPTLQIGLAMYSLWEELEDGQRSEILQRKGALFTNLLELSDSEDGNPGSASFSLNRRALSYLHGYRGLDQEVLPYATFYDPDQEPEPILIRHELYARILRALETHLSDDGGQQHEVLHLIGPVGHGKKLMLRTAARKLGRALIVVDVERLIPANRTELLRMVSLLVEEAFLNDAVLCFFDSKDREENEEEEINQTFPRAITDILILLHAQTDFFVWMSPEKSHYLLEHPFHLHLIEQPLLTVGERKVLWEAKAPQYPLAAEVDMNLCASKFILSAKQIDEVLRTSDYIRREQGKEEISSKDIQEAVKQLSPNQLGRFATKIKAVYTWDDLVVSPQQKHEMELICDQMKYRSTVGEEWGFFKKTAYGRGICALFYGSPGTGKTMAVQVMANEIGLDLYRVDLSQMVSKYIGETEKNISNLFKKARNINALLFFDEADSMFAKRSEVKDSHDKNANAETAHLLQKLEDYEGIAILCTNFINNIDDAFKRRIKFMINFSFPEPEVRLKLWNTILPKQVPCDEEIDFEFFAEKFELAGSNIKEILTNAAFIAAGQGTGLRNRHIIEAIKLNYAKYGKILTDVDFGYLMTQMT